MGPDMGHKQQHGTNIAATREKHYHRNWDSTWDRDMGPGSNHFCYELRATSSHPPLPIAEQYISSFRLLPLYRLATHLYKSSTKAESFLHKTVFTPLVHGPSTSSHNKIILTSGSKSQLADEEKEKLEEEEEEDSPSVRNNTLFQISHCRFHPRQLYISIE